CVTGPNGSGKSNILDAIMFALGENSSKTLRVDKLHSLFHDQSGDRVHRLARTSVSFDNTDRSIPLDSNTVTVTREMPPQGESQYYLNGRKVTKTTITGLLEVVLAVPNELNVVQQGKIMRIAEYDSDERRRIIEDIVGLSYFDDKKAEAMKQLDASDRRLEVAMAKMGEIRNRIDDLEGERNDQLRFQHLERDIRRFRAIKISISIRESRERLESQKVTLEQNLAETKKVGQLLDEVQAQLSQLEAEKDKFLQKVDVHSRAKADVDSTISNKIMKYEQLKASIASGEQRVKQIGQKIPSLMKERERQKKENDIMNAKINELNSDLSVKKEEKRNIAAKLERLTFEHKELLDRQSEINEQKVRLEERLKDLEKTQTNLTVELSVNLEQEKSIAEKLEANTKRANNITDAKNKLDILIPELQSLMDKQLENIASDDQAVQKFAVRKVKIEQQIENTSFMLEKASPIAVQFETKIKMAKNYQQEDYAIAMLLPYAKQFGIIGTFMQLVKWEKEYQHAVFAVASLWMKALVVKDVKKMFKILDHAREMQLPKLRMIPLDIAINQNDRNFPSYQGLRGLLSDFVTSHQARNLVDFIFGDILLVDTTDTAYELAKEGWKTVTVSGELFEPKASAITLDLNSKIIDLTKTILLGESIENLKSSINLLRQLITKKKNELNDILPKVKQVEESKVELCRSLAVIDSQIENAQSSLQHQARNNEEIQARITLLSNLHADTRKKIEELETQQTEMNFKITEINNKLDEIDDQGVTRSIREIDLKKVEVGRTAEHMESEIRERLTVISSHKDKAEGLLKMIGDIDNEIKIIKEEAKEKAIIIKENDKTLLDVKAELKSFRDKEQQLIDTSGNSVGMLREYESKTKVVLDQVNKLSKQMSNLDKDIALNRKEIADLSIRETTLMQDLIESGYREPLMGYDAAIDVADLVKEHDFLRGSINQLADKNYVQIINGYREMSSRKNQLESERNSIVRFIEDIEREKKHVFMQAFDKVNKDIRYMFSRMTGDDGSAWLEIENPDDVFNSGIMFLVQFPDKPPRETTSLSGGEKTIAATTFLLALQSLKPSPFYLFDEIDAHLDAENTERLSRIIVEKSRACQMIIVSLKDVIVANAQMVHGVYPRNGVSQLIKYKSPNVSSAK
ncbi:MAG: chromosome segregation SMC family protein, partial [Nitrososphaerales archaeon]